MSQATCTHEIQIGAPDGAGAVELELRLAHLAPTTVGRGSDWFVEIPAPANLEEIEAVVRAWLDDLGEPSTTIRADGQVVVVESHRSPMRPARHYDFIG